MARPSDVSPNSPLGAEEVILDNACRATMDGFAVASADLQPLAAPILLRSKAKSPPVAVTCRACT